MRDSIIAALWLNLVMALTMAGFFAVPVMAPVIAADLGVDTTLLGTFQAILWGSSLVTTLAAGNLVARFGAVRVAQLCLLLCALGLGAGSVGALPLLALSAVLIGLGIGAETPSSSYLLARITPLAHQPLIFSFKQTGLQVGGIIAGFLFPLLVPSIGWRGSMIAMVSLIAVAMLFLEAPRRRFDEARVPRPAPGGATVWQAIAHVCRDPGLLRLGIASFAFVATQVSVNAFLVSYLVAEIHFTLALAGTMIAAVQAGGLIGRLLWGAISGRVSGAQPLLAALGAGIAACAFAIGSAAPMLSANALMALCFFTGLTANGWNGVFLAEVARRSPRDQVGRVTGAIFIFGTAGLMLGPLAFSTLAAYAGFASAYVMMSLWSVLGVAFLLPWRRAAR